MGNGSWGRGHGVRATGGGGKQDETKVLGCVVSDVTPKTIPVIVIGGGKEG